MKVAIISDNHGNKRAIDKLFERNDFDYLFYLGDGISDIGTYLYLDNVYAVSGNCDFMSSVENERFFELEGIKFFITHGNRYGVKYSMDSIVDRAKEVGAKVVCFGHTHRQLIEERDGILFVNPGSFKRIDGMSIGLYLNIEEGKFSFSSLRIE
ncbi:MAG: metallophosphoesterase [Clostridiales bacterium]|nr:metallophosphoesterase [Clostridiales bacterium]